MASFRKRTEPSYSSRSHERRPASACAHGLRPLAPAPFQSPRRPDQCFWVRHDNGPARGNGYGGFDLLQCALAIGMVFFDDATHEIGATRFGPLSGNLLSILKPNSGRSRGLFANINSAFSSNHISGQALVPTACRDVRLNCVFRAPGAFTFPILRDDAIG